MVAADAVRLTRQHLALLGRPPTAHDIADALRATGQMVSDEVVLTVQEGIARDSTGVGILDPLFASPGLTDILVNGPHQVFADYGAGLVKTQVSFPDDDAVRQLGTRLAASVGRRLDDGSPFVDARLPNGVRFHAILGGIADPGTCLSFRVPASKTLSLEDWCRSGSIDSQGAAILRRIVEKKLAFLVSGGTGSGKTTLLGTLLSLVPSSERIVIVEDSRELDPRHPHTVRLESRPMNQEGAGLVTMTDLVRQALRMRPDRLVVGEVRGGELRDLLQAMNTGHEGGCGTIHANSVADLPARMEALGALGGLSWEATQAQVAAAIRVVVHVARCDQGREVSQIGVVSRDGHGRVRARSAWTRRGGVAGPGEGLPELKEMLA